MNTVIRGAGACLVLTLGVAGARAQDTANNNTGEKVEPRPQRLEVSGRIDPRPEQTIYLKNVGQVNNANEILTAVRIMLEPDVKVFLVPSQNAVLIRGNTEQIALAQRLINELDRPKRLFRLTYTVTESDAGKRVGVMHYATVAASGERATMKQGSRVPIVTGSYDQGKNGAQTQFTYLDIGMNFDMTATESGNGVTLKVKVEQSSIADGESKVGPQDPIVRQAVLDETAEAPLGRPVVLGALDVQGSTRHLEIEVVVDEVH